jgi:hypothetical protein
VVGLQKFFMHCRDVKPACSYKSSRLLRFAFCLSESCVSMELIETPDTEVWVEM